MKLYFVRHGESEANLLNMFSDRDDRTHGLTTIGKAQSFALADKFPARKIDKIYSSPLRRARETANILARRFEVKVNVSPALREYDCGILEGRSDPSSWEIYDTILRDWMIQRKFDQRIEGGESFKEIEDRFVPFVKRIVKEYRSPGGIIFVGHGGLYRCMLPRLLENIDLSFSLAHPLGHTDYVVATAYSADQIICEQWCGREVAQLVI